MLLNDIVQRLNGKNIYYMEKMGDNKYLFCDDNIYFVITYSDYLKRYETNLSYVDKWLRIWQG